MKTKTYYILYLVFLYAVLLANGLAIIGYIISGNPLKILEIYNPFNLINYMVEFIALSPALLFYNLYKRSKKPLTDEEQYKQNLQELKSKLQKYNSSLL